MNYRNEINKRIADRHGKSAMDFNTTLKHFSIISYKVDINKLNSLLPDGINPKIFHSDGKKFALISAVVFKNSDFGLKRLKNFPRLIFFQTNFRAYITDRNKIDTAWFFGTTLGSQTYYIPRKVWGMPWKKGIYKFQHSINKQKYKAYNLNWQSNSGNGLIKIESTNKKMKILEGFDSLDQQLLLLTHPVTGYYYRENQSIGTYKIWHPEMNLHEGKAIEIKLDFFENLGLIKHSQLNNPHSVLITQSIEFDILMPPEILS